MAQYAGLEVPGLVGQNYLVASRTFHKPSGLSNIHIVRFCFSPSQDALAYVEGAGALRLCMANSLASANITDMMKSTNRVKILWPSPFEPSPVLPEHFSAWLEIENVRQQILESFVFSQTPGLYDLVRQFPIGMQQALTGNVDFS